MRSSPLWGLSGFFCRGRVDHPLTNRSPNMMAHWIFASRHHRARHFEGLATQLSAKYNNFVAASSLGKCQRALIARRLAVIMHAMLRDGTLFEM
jgi:hypothetical protein